jgi:hypothetical protein
MSGQMIKDRIMLVVAAIACAAGAACFWRWAGNRGFEIMGLLLLMSSYGTLLTDNQRLRQQVKELQARNQRLANGL